VGVLFAVFAAHPQTLDAQIVQGRVVDAATSQAVPQVTLLVLRGEQGDTVVTRGLTDVGGHFALEVSKSGGYRLRCMVIGYQPVTTPMFDLRAGDPPLEVEVRISQVAVLLAPLEIVSQRPALLADRWLMADGFYDRAHHYGRAGLGTGSFLDRDAIRRSAAFRVSGVVRFLPGVRVIGAGGRREIITFRSAAGRCVPTVFLDGSPLADGSSVNDLVTTSELAAMEVYPSLSMPPEYALYGTRPCGAIVLWTGGTAQEPAFRTSSAARELSLDLTLSADSVGRGDAVVATLVLANRTDTSRTVCITGSHFTLSGTGTSRDIAAKPPRHPCDDPIEIAPRASTTWREVVTLLHEKVGAWLLQKRLDVRIAPCSDGSRCRRSLKSNWSSLVVVSR
jgi:hypothetical protein